MRTVVLGITGGIAAYKMAEVASALTKQGDDVHVIMTKNATEFIAPLTFETLTGNQCTIDTFARDFAWDVKHISLAKRAEVCLVAPATANVIAKMACGIADDMLTTTLLAMQCPIVVAPAMNTAMYENAVTQRNLKTLQELGHLVLETETGLLACRDVGKGRLPNASVLLEALEDALTEKDLSGKHVLVTAGPTCEALDPVRYLTNRSTGKMGYAVAQAAKRRGAEVVLVSGKSELAPPDGVTCIGVESAADMFDAVTKEAAQADWIIKAAAVADFTPSTVAEQKIKKSGSEELTLTLGRTKDILAWLGEHKQEHQKICGFSMETEHMLENSRAKLEKKHADLIIANNVKEEGAGFAGDTNIITMITKEEAEALPKLSKLEAANRILDRIKLL